MSIERTDNNKTPYTASAHEHLEVLYHFWLASGCMLEDWKCIQDANAEQQEGKRCGWND
jgi:hypothetical protein